MSVVEPAATISNCIDLSPDGKCAYYNDTETARTDVYDVYDVFDGERVGRRPVHSGDDGRPDGLAVDSAGNVWVAVGRVGRVRCYSPDARILAGLDLPVRLVTSCSLGGEDLLDLYLTTSRETLDDPRHLHVPCLCRRGSRQVERGCRPGHAQSEGGDALPRPRHHRAPDHDGPEARGARRRVATGPGGGG